jgi:CrcB protein
VSRPDRRAATLAAAVVVGGGALGTLGRAGLAEAWPAGAGGWPWATFAVNVAGAALLGWLVAWLFVAAPPSSELLRLGVGTGFCGGLTTFSAFERQILDLLREGRVGVAGGYAVASIAAGMAAAAAGTRLAGRRR